MAGTLPPPPPPPPPPAVAENFSEALLKQLECPSCLGICAAPIVQCVNGHNLCSRCRAKVKQCVTCHEEISSVRNRFAEEISVTEYSCPNREKGCGARVMLKDMLDHTKGCAHGPGGHTKCCLAVKSADNPMLFLPCAWKGPISKLLGHVKAVHPKGWHEGEVASMSFKLRKQHLFLISVYDNLFWSLLNYDFNTLDMRGAVFAVTDVKPGRFKFQYNFHSVHCTIMKRGIIGGAGDQTYNSTIFQGKRMLDQFIQDHKIIKCKVLIMKQDTDKNSISSQM